MKGLSVYKLFELSKQARKEKDYMLEKMYLEEALSLAPTNLKLINALIRNLKKLGDISEQKRWLETLYQLSPNGKILFELMQLEQKSGNHERVKEILLENARIDPNSKKVKNRLKKVIDSEKEIAPIKNYLFTLTEEVAELIRNARETIYSVEDYASKYETILQLLGNQSEEILLAVMAEFYLETSFQFLAVDMIKKYKRKLSEEDIQKGKLANQLLQLVVNKKTKKLNWNTFWIDNSTIYEEKDSPKVFIKSNFLTSE